MNAPPSVWVGLTVPQALPPLQVTIQSTPSFEVSLFTTAVIAELWFTGRYLGGGVANETLIAVDVDVISIVHCAVTEVFAVEVAVIVTLPSLGTEAGAVKIVAVPLVVCVGLKEPHAPAGIQFTVQSTPALEESPVTFAVIEVVSATPSEDGGVGEIATLTELEEHPARLKVSKTANTSNHGPFPAFRRPSCCKPRRPLPCCGEPPGPHLREDANEFPFPGR
jgi:hypothetical protein